MLIETKPDPQICVNSANSNVDETPRKIFGEKVYRQTDRRMYSRTYMTLHWGFQIAYFADRTFVENKTSRTLQNYNVRFKQF